MKSNKTTLKDIEEALSLVKEYSNIERIDYNWGWAKFNNGEPIEIGFNREYLNELMETTLFNIHPSNTRKPTIVTCFGIPVVVS